MLIIRKEQMDVLSQYILKRFFDSMEQHLKQRYPEQTAEMEDEQLRRLIIKAVEEAKGFDITDENDVKRFLEYIIEYGCTFGKSSETMWARKILCDKNISGTAKMDEIDHYDLFVITLGKS